MRPRVQAKPFVRVCYNSNTKKLKRSLPHMSLIERRIHSEIIREFKRLSHCTTEQVYIDVIPEDNNRYVANFELTDKAGNLNILKIFKPVETGTKVIRVTKAINDFQRPFFNRRVNKNCYEKRLVTKDVKIIVKEMPDITNNKKLEI